MSHAPRNPEGVRSFERRGAGRLVAAGALVAVSGLHLLIAANTKGDALDALVPIGWTLGVTGLLAAYALSQRWRIGPLLALVFVGGTVVWIVMFVVMFRAAFEELGDREPLATASAEP